MSYSSEDETDISESELEEYVDRCYGQLKDGDDQKVKFSDELFRCPYCPGKKKLVYPLKDLLQHASDMGKDIKHKGKHLALVRYLKNDLDQENISSEFSGLTLESNGVNELFVWPWMGILANVDGEVSSGLKNDLIKRGFDPVRVRLLSSAKYAVIDFKKDWSGFYNAIKFEKEFEVDGHGKKEYHERSDLGDKLYGWVARSDDYGSKGMLGEYLQKNGDLKTVADVEADEKRKNGLLIANLADTIDKLRARVEELEANSSQPPAVFSHVASQTNEIL